jgi:hypothetical protein
MKAIEPQLPWLCHHGAIMMLQAFTIFRKPYMLCADVSDGCPTQAVAAA